MSEETDQDEIKQGKVSRKAKTRGTKEEERGRRRKGTQERKETNTPAKMGQNGQKVVANRLPHLF